VADLVPFVPDGLREEFESVASALDEGIGNGDAIRAEVRIGTVFGLAKEYIDLLPDDIVRLLQSRPPGVLLDPSQASGRRRR